MSGEDIGIIRGTATIRVRFSHPNFGFKDEQGVMDDVSATIEGLFEHVVRTVKFDSPEQVIIACDRWDPDNKVWVDPDGAIID